MSIFQASTIFYILNGSQVWVQRNMNIEQSYKDTFAEMIKVSLTSIISYHYEFGFKHYDRHHELAKT